MHDISEEIDRENSIITDLLSLVKMDKKASDLNIETVNINDLLELVLKRLRPIAGKKQVELILDSFRPVNAEVDATKLTPGFFQSGGKRHQIQPAGGRLGKGLPDADHKYFYVTVADSGIGIPEESLNHIFERFYRVDKSHSREIGGTGLGLAITRSAIVMHRGRHPGLQQRKRGDHLFGADSPGIHRVGGQAYEKKFWHAFWHVCWLPGWPDVPAERRQ